MGLTGNIQICVYWKVTMNLDYNLEIPDKVSHTGLEEK